ncbi:hypothetical protein CHLRE_13g582050v5 [Chlamydomonas reinhardtii]|uniref:Uncharacterized protein n=1 Tax=Chlamydomonas reinhardtii TaxID=3055 RepID=A0A2K3D0G8_CHLRE|nr:uncharacterized protein CHLRE_13g582050v5 [Chlamydomonas reinhardtii]PNW74017.1 hypothetical protein CHLRE_13g582050v5 [Chlamydomonas reinhardtii]
MLARRSLLQPNVEYVPFWNTTSRGMGAEDIYDVMQIDACYKHLQPLLDRGDLELPDERFVHNVDDNMPRWCGPDKNCTAPLLSIIKTADGAAGIDTNILIPQFLFLAKSTYHYP